MPTSASITFTGQKLEPAQDAGHPLANVKHVAFAPNLNLAVGTVLGKITATGKYAAYNNANVDGTETAVPLITMYPIVTDASGNITNLSESGSTFLTGPCYTLGLFRCEDLTGLDAAAVTDIKGSIVLGNTTTGLLKF